MGESKPAVPDSATLPDTGDLLAFCRVVDLGSMTAAGRALGESKGTVSRRVARLEEQLGTALLRRDGRAVAPTEEGRLYRERVGIALDALQGAAQALQDGHASPSGLLRITAPPGFAGGLLRPLLPGFLAAWPDVRVELLLTESVLSFREHRVDVAFRLSQGLPDSALVAHRLDRLEVLLLAAPQYLDRRGRPQHPEDLTAHDLLTAPIEESRTLTFVSGGARSTVRLTGRVLSHDVPLLYDLALAGAGITLGPARLATADIEAGRLERVLPGWDVALGVHLYLLHAGGLLPPKVRVFRDYVRDALVCPG